MSFIVQIENNPDKIDSMIDLKGMATKVSYLIYLLFFCAHLSAQGGHHIKVKIDNYNDETLMIGYHMGNKTYVRDTVVGMDSNGYFHFKGDEVLEGGLYIVLTRPNHNYFEFVVPSDTEQHFTLTTALNDGDMIEHLLVEGSKENQIFIEYVQFLAKSSMKAAPWQQRKGEIEQTLKGTEINNSAALVKELDMLNDKLNMAGSEIEAYQNNLMSKYPKSLVRSIMRSSRKPEVPVSITNSNEQYRYYKNHYWDQFEWTDARMIRTPILEQKLEFYMDRLSVAHPDSIIVACDYLMDKALKSGNKEIYQTITVHLLNKYAKSDVVCMDKVYMHMGTTYYCGAITPYWIEEEQLNKICINVNNLKHSVCGVKAAPINLTDISTGKRVDLYNVKKEYILVYFWGPNSGHSKQETRKLIPIYQKWKDKGFEVYGVCTSTLEDIEDDQSSITDLGMLWSNVSGNASSLFEVKEKYNIQSSPSLYLLNGDKEIIYKRIGVDQLESILERHLGSN